MVILVKEYMESGQSQKAFAASHGINEGKLHYWIKKLSNPDNTFRLSGRPAFVPIEIAPSPSRKTDRAILIRLTSGVEIEIPV